MNHPLQSLVPKTRSMFAIAAVLLVINAIGAGLNSFANAEVGLVIKEIFQAAGYGMAFIAGLSLVPGLREAGAWLIRVATGLESLGALGCTVLTVAYVLSPLGLISEVPGWVQAFGAGVPLGQIGLLLLGIGVLRSKDYPRRFGVALMGPLAAFIIFFVAAASLGEENAPVWAPFVIVSLQTVAHLLIALIAPAGEPATREPAQQTTNA